MHHSAEQHRRERVGSLAAGLHAGSYDHLLRVARRNGAEAEADAEEAVGFAFLSFLERYDPESGSPPLGWMTLTVRRACWAAAGRRRLGRRVSRGVPYGSSSPSTPAEGPGPEEAIHRREELGAARRRLGALKPDQRAALLMQAAGFSYREIAERRRWTLTKTNRSIYEGRAALRAGAAR